MNTKIRSPLSRKLILYIVLSSSVVTLFLTVFQLYRDYKADVQAIDASFEQIKNVHLKTIELTVWATDKDKLQSLLDGISNLPDIEYVSVDNGDEVISVGRITSGDIISWSKTLTYPYRGKILEIGVLRVVANLDAVYSRIVNRAVVILISNAIKTILVAGLMLLIFFFIVTRHLVHIADFISKVSLNKSFEPLKLNRGSAKNRKEDELDKVVNSVNDAATRVTRAFSEAKKAEDAQRKSEERLKAILNNTTAVVYLKDTEGRFIFVNPQYETLFHVTNDTIRGKTDYDIFPKETADTFRKNDLSVLKENAPIEMEEAAPHDDGIHTYISIKFPLHDRDGEPYAICGISTDITERKQAENALRRTSNELENRVKERTRELSESMKDAKIANRAKSDLMANMSHELRTPLNAIIGFSSTMKSETFGPLNEKYLEYATDINRSGEHLLELINDILDVSALEAGKLNLHEENLDVGKVVETTIHMVSGRAAEGNIRLTSNTDDGLPELHADKRRLIQILLNLLSNAIKFTSPDGEVTLSASLDGGEAHVFTVADTGIGMDEEGLAKAMSKFGQVDSGLNRKQEGTGLGLPLTQELIELHAGTFEIKSKKGEGTTVTVRFPPERFVDS